jgi:hypothetical protein
MANASLTFLSWLRRGLAADLQAPGEGETQARLRLDVNTKFAKKSGAVAHSAGVTLPFVGPGEIVGLDARTVVKMTPGPNETDAEYKHFAALELDQQLAPWFVLLVVEDGPGEATFDPPTPERRLPVLTVTDADLLAELDLTDSWAWAHVQLAGVTVPTTTPDAAANVIREALGGPRGKVTVRLFSPRRLEPQKPYRACLVPAYERGRQAGLGQPVTADAGALAWTDTTAAPLPLPVYHHWTFHTGLVGGFRDLARAIVPRALPPEVGRRAMDVSSPGFAMKSAAADGTLDMVGALQSIQSADADTDATREPVAQPFIDDLNAFLRTSERNLAEAGVKRVVVPPLYGRWHAAIPTPAGSINPQLAPLGAPPTTPPTNRKWFYELNSDPRNRAGAGLGTSVVQAHDQDLMASAWDQAGSLRAANQQRRLLQLGREALTSGWTRHALRGGTGNLLQLTAVLHGQVLATGSTETLRSHFGKSPVGLDVLEPQWRRLARPRGRVGRFQGRATAPPAQDPIALLNEGFQPAPEPPVPDGMVTVPDAVGSEVPGNLPQPTIDIVGGQASDRQVFWAILLFCVSRKLLVPNREWPWWWLLEVLRFGLGVVRIAASRGFIDLRAKLRDGTLTGNDIRNGPKLGNFQVRDPIPTDPVPPPTSGQNDSPQGQAFRTAWAEAVDFLALPRLDHPVLVKLNLPSVVARLDQALHPKVTLVAWMKKLINLVGLPETNDPLEPIQAAPEFEQPMWEPLRDLSPEWILPGLDRVEPNTAAVAVPNQRFIEAYMVGLNHEMARELLWNEYPTDQRGSYFRQFWDVRGYVPGPNDPTNDEALKESLRDIAPVHGWGPTKALGTNSPRPRAPRDYLVLVIRGELIRRYPTVVVYAVKAEGQGRPTGAERFPAFSGRMSADAAFYGFDLTQSEVRGTPGSPTDQGWFFVLQQQPAEPLFDPPAGLSSRFVTSADVAADTAAELATLTFLRPTRVALHGARMLPAP